MLGFNSSSDIGEIEGDFPSLELPEPHILHMGAFRHAPRSLGEAHPLQPGIIRSVTFSDDGLHCLSASGDGKVRVYDVGTVVLRDQLNIGCAKTAFSHSSAIAITTPYHVSDASVGFIDIEEGVYISQIPINGNDALLGSKRDRNEGVGMSTQLSSDSQSESSSTSATASTSRHHDALLRGGGGTGGRMLGPMCTSISVSPSNDVTCVGCKTGEVFLVDPSIGTPLVSIHTSGLESVVGTCFSRCGKYIVVVTSFSVEVHTLANMLGSSSLTNNKQNTARVVYTMPPCHRNSSMCTGYTSVDCGTTDASSSSLVVIMVGCGCGEGDLLHFDMHTSTMSKVGGFAIATPARCFSIGVNGGHGGDGLVPSSTGLPFRVPAAPTTAAESGGSDITSLTSRDTVVGVWKAPSCGALFATPSNTNTSLVIQGTHTNNNRAVTSNNDNKQQGGSKTAQDSKDTEERCTGVVIRDPLVPSKFITAGDDGDNNKTIDRRQLSAARAFLSCEHDSGGAPRVLAVNPRFGIVAGAHRVLNWWALDSNNSSSKK